MGQCYKWQIMTALKGEEKKSLSRRSVPCKAVVCNMTLGLTKALRKPSLFIHLICMEKGGAVSHLQ